MEKSKIVLLVQFMILISALNQPKIYGQITGSAVDAKNEPIPFVNVILYNATDTTIVKGASTSMEGEFSILQEITGNYIVGLSSLGYHTYYSDIFEIGSTSQSHDLGIITMVESANELDEVIITERKNIVQNTSFGKVINVQSSIMTKGSNALQVLERLPGILVDRRNNQFNLNGQNGVTVMFNGRKMPLSMEEVLSLLESTLADTIEKIELITTPTANYDADGGGGIINIIFKKNEYEGNQLNVNTSVGYGFKEKASASFQYAYGKNKVSIHTSYSISNDHGKNGFEGSGTGNMPFIGAPSDSWFSTNFNHNRNSHNFNLGAIHQLDSITEIGGELTYTLNQIQSVSDINNSRKAENQDFFRYHISSEMDTKKDNFISSLYLRKKLSKNSSLNMDFNYLTYFNDSPAIANTKYYNAEEEEIRPENEIFTDGNRGQSKSSIRFGVFKADYALKISRKVNNDFGIKLSYSTNKNDSKIETNKDGAWEVDPRSQSVISSDEKLWAAYSQFKFLLSEKATLNAGIRYENWNRTISNAENPFSIKQFFPSFSYHYKLRDNQNVNLHYHRRISRPSYADLVTSLYYNDPTAIFTGNPLLKPAITNTFQLDYNAQGFNVGLSYQRELNPIFRYQFTSTPQNDILIISPQNGDYQKSLNLFLNIPVHWANWAKLNVSSTSSFRKYGISYIPDPAEKSYFYQNLNINQTIKLPFELDMELSGWYNFPSYNGSHITQGFGIINFGLAKKLKKDWGTLQFTITDLFKTFNVDNHNGGMAPVVFDIDTKSRYRDESSFSRIFRISYSRSFGNMTGRKTTKTKAMEEINRIE